MKLLGKAKAFVRQRMAPREHHLLFAFTGGSGAWPEMGRSLYRDDPVFRESIEASGAVVEQVLGWRAASRFRGEDASPATFEVERRNDIIHLGMLQIAQVDLWRAAGVRPGGVVSVSLGEMVAPYAAGALSRDDSARVLAAVAQAISRATSGERMFILDADRATARRLASSAPAPLDYLGSMAPRDAVVLSRESDAGTIRSFLGDAVVRELPSDWNYHTPRLDVDRTWLGEQLRDLRSLTPFCPIYSAAAGGMIPAGSPFDASFFGWMVSRPFLYEDAVRAALRDGFDTVVTIGPEPANNGYINRIAAGHGTPVRLIDSMRSSGEQQAWHEALSAVRSLKIGPPAAEPAGARPLAPGHPASFEVYEALRQSGTVHYLVRDRYWIIVGYEEVQRALGDPQRFSNRTPDLQEVDPVLLGNDPPAHTAVRRLLMRYFSPEAVARRAQLAEEKAEELLQPLAAGQELDVVRDFAHPLAAAIAADIIGLKPEQAPALSAPMLESGGNLPKLYARMQEPVAAMSRLSPLYADLISDGFDDAAARSLMRLLWIAGTTPQHAVAPAVRLLLEDQSLRRRLQSDPSLVGAFVDESLRLDPPAHLVPRIATEDVRIGGRTIPAGARVQLALAAANRDPARFDDPAALRLDRVSNPHLAFGGGVHRCIGAALGRAILVAAVGTLLRVAPDFRAVQPLSTIRYAPEMTRCEIEQLVIGS